MSNEILSKVEEFNNVCLSSTSTYAKSEVLLFGQVACAEDVAILESKIGTNIPGDLKDFYNRLGGLKCRYMSDCNSITIFSINYLIENLDNTRILGIRSLGLLDMVMYNWGNDRSEITQLPEATRTYINDSYFCFGWYTINDVLESTNYLYFDKEGGFGAAFCHEENFDEFLTNYINPLMHKSLATRLFEDLILESMEEIITLKKVELG